VVVDDHGRNSRPVMVGTGRYGRSNRTRDPGCQLGEGPEGRVEIMVGGQLLCAVGVACADDGFQNGEASLE
jgi:hypothetical protein